MNVFRRMKDIVTSNVNSALDRMEDPEKMIDLSIRQLEDAVTEMRGSLAEKRQEMKTLEREAADLRELMARWTERASLAIEKGLDGMAREAVGEKMKAEEKARLTAENMTILRNVLTSTEANIEEAQNKLEELKATSGTLKARAKLAKDRVDMNRKSGSTEDAEYARRMEELRSRIERWEEEAGISFSPARGESAEPTFQDLEREAAIEKELEAIRNQKSAPKEIEEN